ncbi:cytidine/deoxycytidylate deaminase family protein [Cucurbitaria berberidis CBS 394.84]|uniref:Cytidine/deoxycytidylate deaminase family protein n=1 Tax=Cucurbitaria berberidis CBS 394.84 TaxID=1168544 RepID=A0A9P4GIA7_9PLEO|nr:cytidine/deoxycytidylate deaminase family protein [Cucurbitaria berberidis CBS 394.84]KAF1846105.1 cytidine/deoxycytidylate deaminase family protein [Cucurbitaria berberidis CBS 394.84]
MSAPVDTPPPSKTHLLSTLLSTIEERIIPLTQQGVSSGSKLFGAAILSRTTLHPYTTATNNERISPLLHGEINCIQQFFTADFPDPTTRPDPARDCIFLATHEPCSLCLSGIAWSGFSEVYFLFSYEESRDLFAIPHDIEILREVFTVRSGLGEGQGGRAPLYNRRNKFFHARSLDDVAGAMEEGDDDERRKWVVEIDRVKGLYGALSDVYQQGKMAGAESSSIWK